MTPSRHQPPLHKRSLASLADTAALAAAVAPLAAVGDVIALAGDLGAGKTTFARFFIAALTGEAVEVPSPTFNLVLTYDTPAGTVWHFDLYRLDSPREAFELGIEEAFADGISLIEWPERLGDLLPDDSLEIRFAESGQQRSASLSGGGTWPRRLAGLEARS